ncbi:hypothetical protein GGR21_003345 [Dysgonomonas hofstadii]|uniref:Glycosyl transferase family 11 n=1 Tax=Dysgonomonas hofstadii TaxID=637886 RepID=A0A840CTE8_9BACT|nr:alpha-1,2-fucosyltransferase [Dysgonomonas hofstadii]MBB4037428.1 hypothetical protein [Dysgonomonas hofstadii]
MVNIILSGGLGNQMFQYATARALAERLQTCLVLDSHTFGRKTEATARNFELSIFNINYPVKSTFKGTFLIKAYPFIQKYRGFFQKLGFFTDTYAILYQPVFERLRGNITMFGYFQNEQYFKNIASVLQNDFTFRQPLTDKNLELAEKIKAGNSVAMHIRRGDYLTNKSAISNFVTCDINYYRKAIDHISLQIVNPEFYIFSDDTDWVKNNINFVNHPVSFIDWNRGDKSYIDMQLMSICKHNIIANSSFSWWGAWLNENPDKVVIAPGKWFREEKKNNLLDSFYPKGWIKI